MSPGLALAIYGLTKPECDLLHQQIIAPLKCAGAKVWIFGSRARGDFKKFSDVDILYEFPEDRPCPSGLLYDLKTAIEESRLPYRVDLVATKDVVTSYRKGIWADRIPL